MTVDLTWRNKTLFIYKQKLLVLPLLLGFTSAVNADSNNYYLLLRSAYNKGGRNGSWTVPMESMGACEKALNKAMIRKGWVYRSEMASSKGADRGICLSNK